MRHGTALLFAALALAARAEEAPPAEGPRVDWKRGPAPVELGKGLAQIALPEGFLFAGPEDARALLERMGNRTDGSELGLIVPTDEKQDWFLVLEWSPVGYVKDTEKDSIDADAILESIRKGTEANNEWRKGRGLPALHVVGWTEAPHYDQRTHNLVWATLARNEAGRETGNYNVRLLGREGYMALTLVDVPERIAAAKPGLEQLLGATRFKQGKTYAEWVPGDKVAQYGLTALVAGGAGAAAVKLGLFKWLGQLLAKSGKLVALAVAALAAGAAKLWRMMRGRPEPRPPPA